ncbi:MAG: thioredoxin family protein [Microscillaceae bacterium]|jgi:hypothetical protein|nr:thioredoxin family protein [Microscillaceae bacterium]
MNIEKSNPITSPETLQKAYNYAQYRTLIDNLLAEGKTTGPNQTTALTEYTQMNVQRMNRWDKTAIIREDLKTALEAINRPLIWVVLTEGWCGDAAQNIPTIVKMAEINPKIELKFLLRDENLPIMDNYLTNGGRAIPKLICIDAESGEELGTWGPRPSTLQDWVMAEKKKTDFDFKTFAEYVHKWYATNKTEELQDEFLALVQGWQ